MPVSATICGGMLRPGIDERGQLAQHRAAAHLDRADLGDRVMALAGGPSAGGLEVDDDERGLPQRQVSQRINVREAELAHALKVGNGTDSGRLPRAGDCRWLSIPCGRHRSRGLPYGHGEDRLRRLRGARSRMHRTVSSACCSGCPRRCSTTNAWRSRCSPTSGWHRDCGWCRFTGRVIRGSPERHAADAAVDNNL